jgi:DNA-binding IclR family transcriptional regulator
MSKDTVLLAVDHVLEFLATDKAWHTIDDIAENTLLPRQEIKEMVYFLAANQFVKLNDEGKRAKIEESLARFLTQIQDIENLSTH